jgi:hypothetical protein
MTSLTPRCALKEVPAESNLNGRPRTAEPVGPSKRNDVVVVEPPLVVQEQAWCEHMEGASKEDSEANLEKNTDSTYESKYDDVAVAEYEEDTFITTVPTQSPAETPSSGKGNINAMEERLITVQEEQAKMRAELEAYVKELSSRTDESGEKLLEFPTETEGEKEAKREAEWRKHISDHVLDHPSEEEDRKMKMKIELGFDRIDELDKALEDAELKYMEHMKAQQEVRKAEKSVKTSENEEIKNRFGGEKVLFKDDDEEEASKSPSRAESLNKRSAELGRQVLLTEEEESRVEGIMSDMMGEIRAKVDSEIAGKPVQDETDGNISARNLVPNAYCVNNEDSQILVHLEEKLVEHRTDREHAAPTGLVFDERRGTYILVDPADVNIERSAREPSLQSDDILASMRRKRIELIKLEQIDSALNSLKGAPVHVIENTSSRGDRDRSRNSRSPARKPTSLRAILKPVSPRHIRMALEKAKEEVVDIAEKSAIESIIVEAKKSIVFVEKDIPEEVEGKVDEVGGKGNTQPSPLSSSTSDCSISKTTATKDRRKKQSPRLKRSASMAAAERQTGAHHVEVSSSASSLHAECTSSPTEAKSVFGWERTANDRYIPGSKKPVKRFLGSTAGEKVDKLGNLPTKDTKK